MKWIKLLGESSVIPSDKKSINDSFSKDVSDEKFIPTEEFAKNVYDKVNRDFFLNYLPSDVEFKIKIPYEVESLGLHLVINILYMERHLYLISNWF